VEAVPSLAANGWGSGQAQATLGLPFLLAYLAKTSARFHTDLFQLGRHEHHGMTAWYLALLIRDFAFTQGEAGRYLGDHPSSAQSRSRKLSVVASNSFLRSIIAQ